MYASATLTWVTKMDSTPIITSLLLPMAPMVTWHHPHTCRVKCYMCQVLT